MSFKFSETEKIFSGRFSKKLPQGIQRLAARKLTMLHFAKSLTDLRIPPANRLEALSGEFRFRLTSAYHRCSIWAQPRMAFQR
jgi:proteic killer suppression protein